MSSYTFNDVLIKPKYSEVLSRSNVSLECKLGNHSFDLPVISANMRTITGHNMATTIAKHGGLGILHRFCNISDNVDIFTTAKNNLISQLPNSSSKTSNIGVSVGVQDNDKERFDKLYEAGASLFCIDVAHGHHVLVKNMIKYINNIMGKDRNLITLIAGNIASSDAYSDLSEWGADVIKCGVGPGMCCQTRQNTGVGVPQLSMLEEIDTQRRNQIKSPHIIADGGIKCVGDVAKALKYADMVMIGGYISGTSETPGNVYKGANGQYYKVYGGSASGENKGENKFVEGMTKTVDFRGKVKYILKEIREGLQSSCSYVGANNLNEFKDKCEFVHISSGGRSESKI